MRSERIMKTHDKFGSLQPQKDIPTFDSPEFVTGKPKSEATMDKMRRHVLGDVMASMSAKKSPRKTARINLSSIVPGRNGCPPLSTSHS